MEINEQQLVKYSGAKSLEDLKSEIMEWIDRSKRTSDMGGYSNSFCADEILMIFHCVLHKLREKKSTLSTGGLE